MATAKKNNWYTRIKKKIVEELLYPTQPFNSSIDRVNKLYIRYVRIENQKSLHKTLTRLLHFR